jgi:transcriptional regulator with XRE-family HTH domain
MDIGERLKEARGELSQVEFARLIGVTKNTVGRYERGEREPDIEYLTKTYKTLNINPTWLLTGDGPKTLDDHEKHELSSEIFSDTIGERIKHFRMNLRYKVGEFAKIIGISQGSLSDIENSKTKPSADTLGSIVRHTDIEPNWLIAGFGPMKKYTFKTGDGRPFPSLPYLDQDRIDYDLIWKVVDEIQFALNDLGMDPQDLLGDKRAYILILLYSDAKLRGHMVDEKCARMLCYLAYCPTCGANKLKEP